MNIGLIYVGSIENMGDEILFEVTKYLILQQSYTRIKCIELNPKYLSNKLDTVIYGGGYSLLAFIGYYGFRKDYRYKLINYAYQLKLRKFFSKQFKDLDAIVFSVGMLKFSTQDFSFIFSVISKIAEEKGIPIFLSAMSIERENTSDWRYHQLVNVVNSPCIKMITTRDGMKGVEILAKDYMRKDHVDYVGDPALWIPECYGITKQASSTTVGINVIRKNIYKDYGFDFSGKQLLDMYISIIRELEKRNIDYILFCNGMKEDYSFGKAIIKEANLPSSKLLMPPTSAKELVSMISGFKAVFGARLHACITAFSLDVPVVGLLWDNKLRYFSETMGIEEFFCELSELDGKIIVDKIERAMSFRYDDENRQYYKRKTEESLKNFISSIATRRL